MLFKQYSFHPRRCRFLNHCGRFILLRSRFLNHCGRFILQDSRLLPHCGRVIHIGSRFLTQLCRLYTPIHRVHHRGCRLLTPNSCIVLFFTPTPVPSPKTGEGSFGPGLLTLLCSERKNIRSARNNRVLTTPSLATLVPPLLSSLRSAGGELPIYPSYS